MDTGSQAAALWDWITARVNAGAPPPMTQGGTSLFKKPKRIYRGEVTDTAGTPGHFIIGIFPEIPGGFLDSRAGLAGRAWVTGWSDTLDNAERLYAWLKFVLTDPEPTMLGDRTVHEFAISKGSQVHDVANKAWGVPMMIDVETLAAVA